MVNRPSGRLKRSTHPGLFLLRDIARESKGPKACRLWIKFSLTIMDVGELLSGRGEVKRIMKQLLVLIVVLLLAGCVNKIEDPPAQEVDMTDQPKYEEFILEEPKNAEEVELIEHVDGDTSKFEIDGKIETVRYLLIDTPETKHPKLEEQPLGEEASFFVKNLLEKTNRITLEYDVEKRDKYGRVLAYVYVDGVNVQELLLKRGLARVGYIYESQRHLENFRKAEDFAEENNIGIWECPEYVTDGGFEKEKWCKEAKGTGKLESMPYGSYDPQGPDRDCSDFRYQKYAQLFFEAAGGPKKDPHRLDPDKDGVACENLP